MDVGRPHFRPRARGWTRAVLAGAAVATVGCTMCPDPLDYSGPVPNGSAPQNDFRARSGGILPLGASPRPWPTVVQAGGGAEAAPAAAARSVLAEEDDQQTTAASDVRQTGGIGDESADDTPHDAASGHVVPFEPVPLEVLPERAAEAAAPDDPPVPPAVPFELRETPGWRPKLP